MNDDDNAVVVKDLYKSFQLPHEQSSGLKQSIVNFTKRKKGYETQRVLNDVSFEIKKGEFFGIVGRNGSGKSTLLKLLAGIYAPEKGLVKVNGSLTPFIELGVGFNPELTGRENVYMNGALLGFDRKQMDKMYGDIVSFAELEKFMDQRLKNYSSGMQVRLAFSIAIRANTPILLIDEVLAVGDSKFQKKCYTEFRKLKNQGRTIIFVTHDMSAVERFCTRALVLKEGKVLGIYSPQEAASIYENMNISDDARKTMSDSEKRWGTGKVTIGNISLQDRESKHEEANVIKQGHTLDLIIDFKKNLPESEKIIIGLAFYDSFGDNISGPNSQKETIDSTKAVRYSVSKLSLVPGEYSLTVAIYDENSEEEYDHINEAIKFKVVSDSMPQYGKINLFGKWKQL